MPAPAECRANLKIQEFEGTYKRSGTMSQAAVNCAGCSIKSEFIADTRFFQDPEKVVIDNARDFVIRGCRNRISGQALILPQGL